ncbi:MAG: DUF2061 domain-containing protein [Pseudomonadota bacterium]
MHACTHGFRATFFSAKTASYAAMHFVVAIAVAYALTLDWRKALAIGIIEPIVQTFAFALHDRYWKKREGEAAVPDTRAPCGAQAATVPS